MGETQSVERETQEWVPPDLQAKRDSKAQQARRATGRLNPPLDVPLARC